jgi:DNA excision repair protein ERCC-4
MTERSDGEVRAVVDANEPTRMLMLVLDHPDITAAMEENLATADMVVNGVGFERKTPNDFVNSMTEGRLVEQATRLSDDFEHAYALLEGSIGDFRRLRHSDMNAASARGMMASVMARYGVPVIPTGGPPVEGSDGEREKRKRTRELIDMAVRLGRKHSEEPVSDHLPTGPVEKDAPYGMRMWGTLPRVGPELAGRLYDEYGSPVRLLDKDYPLVEALTAVRGIGEDTAQRIVAAMFEEVERDG